MCLAIPGKIVNSQTENGICVGQVQFGAVTRQTCLDLVPEAVVGDYVLVHVGLNERRYREEAERTYALLESLGLLGDELGTDLEN